MAVKYKVAVTSKTQLTHKIWQLNIKLVAPPQMDFAAGQCVSFHAAEKEERLYSIINPPVTGAINTELSFCADVSPMGFGSKLVLRLKPGDEFALNGPHGVFLVKDFTRDLLFICTGAGVAPFKSMVADALARGFAQKITLIFGVRDESGIFYFDFFRDLAARYQNFEFIPTLSQPKGDWSGSRGRVTDLLAIDPQKYLGRLAYICGGLQMIKDTRAALVKNGFIAKDIKLENFG